MSGAKEHRWLSVYGLSLLGEGDFDRPLVPLRVPPLCGTTGFNMCFRRKLLLVPPERQSSIIKFNFTKITCIVKILFCRIVDLSSQIK